MSDPLEEEAEDTISKRPDADESAAATEEQRQRQKFDGLRDRDGMPFDARFHRTDKSGDPVLNNDGTLKRKPGAGSPNARGGAKPSRVSSPDKYDRYRSTAVGVVESVQMLGMLIGGDEWQYIRNTEYGIDERAQGIEAWTAFCREHDVQDFPPNVAVAVWGAAYVGIRLTQPKTRNRLKAGWHWARAKISRKKGVTNARDDSWDNE